VLSPITDTEQTIKRLKCFCRFTKTDSGQYQCSRRTVDLHANPMNRLAKLNVWVSQARQLECQ